MQNMSDLEQKIGLFFFFFASDQELKFHLSTEISSEQGSLAGKDVWIDCVKKKDLLVSVVSV